MVAPTERMLVACAAWGDSCEGDRAVDAVCMEGIDWRRAAALSMRHGVAQLVQLRIRHAGGRASLPEDARAWFEGSMRANTERNRVLLRELALIAHALEAESVPFRVLKGAALCVTVYADHGLRNFSDLDILVPPERFRDAGRALALLGFRQEPRLERERSLEEVYTRESDLDILTGTVAIGFDPRLTAEGIRPFARRVTVEMHRGLFRDAIGRHRPADIRPAISGRRRAVLPTGASVPILPPEANLVYLAAHAADHGFDRLAHFVDVAQCLRQYRDVIDWGLVFEIADLWREDAALFQMLDFVRTVFGQAVPESGLAGPPRGRRMPPITVERVLCTAHGDGDERTLARIAMVPGMWERVASVQRALFPPVPVMKERYGAVPRVAAAYFSRPLWLLGRAIRAAARARIRRLKASSSATGSFRQ